MSDRVCFPVTLRNITLGYVKTPDYNLPDYESQQSILENAIRDNRLVIELNSGIKGRIVCVEEKMYLESSPGVKRRINSEYDYDLYSEDIHLSIN